MRDPVRLIALLLATLCWPTAPAAALNPDQLLDRAGPAVVTVRAFAGGASVGAGSGVVLPSGRIGAGCRQVDTAGAWRIGQDGHSTAAVLVAADRDGRLCLFAPADPIGTPSRPRLGRLRPNATVYVVGRPRGLEATATPGRVIRAGDGRTNPIQTTAAVSPGADGGGLFDDQGRLAGVASLERQDGHWLARPVAQLLALDSTPALGSAPAPAAGAEAGPDWPGRAMVLEQSGDREGLLAWCRRWTAAEASSADAWFALGTAYSLLGRSSAAIDSYRRTVRLDPRHLDAWFNLGLTYGRLGRHRDAIRALRRTLEIDPADAEAWSQLGLAYLAAGNRESARAVAAELAGLDPERAADLRRRAGLDPPPADSHRHPAGVQGVAPGRAAP
ncbi:MAG: serine protease [Desulfobulbus sp.]|mgnify:CR=1 FL=1|uniref:tetratricopeptide repeat-containing S1 family peptidase n=1 Tax=uncultured Desulfobulbus sp. TaxID=239745 RepID=UPI001B7669A5|nr:tetratricopeptide repeat-containing serine protease family protein [uncultured Desulfobulbus sp.]MBP7518349.1 serine protease [Desulfobulbus sp.]